MNDTNPTSRRDRWIWIAAWIAIVCGIVNLIVEHLPGSHP